VESVEVAHVKLGNPPKGYRTIVFPDGLRERNMLVEAEDDWGIYISIDRSQAPKEIFCLTVSPKGDEFRVTRMTNMELPKAISFSGKDIPKGIRGSLAKLDPNKIISSVQDRFKEKSNG